MPRGMRRKKTFTNAVSPAPAQTSQSFLDKETSFEGKLAFSGNIQIDGQFKGEVRSEGAFVVGESAEIEARVSVARAVIHGQFKGEITATELLEIGPNARLEGQLRTHNLQISKGAFVNAQIETQFDAGDGVITLPVESREESLAE